MSINERCEEAFLFALENAGDDAFIITEFYDLVPIKVLPDERPEALNLGDFESAESIRLIQLKADVLRLHLKKSKLNIGGTLVDGEVQGGTNYDFTGNPTYNGIEAEVGIIKTWL